MDVKQVSRLDPQANKHKQQEQEKEQSHHQEQQASSSSELHEETDSIELDSQATSLYAQIENNLPPADAVLPWFFHDAYPSNNKMLLNLSRLVENRLIHNNINMDFNEIVTQVRKHVLTARPWLEPPYDAYYRVTGTALDVLVKKGHLSPPHQLMEAEQQLLQYWVNGLKFRHTDLQSLSLLVLGFTVERWQKQRYGEDIAALSLNSFDSSPDSMSVLAIPAALKEKLQGFSGTPA